MWNYFAHRDAAKFAETIVAQVQHWRASHHPIGGQFDQYVDDWVRTRMLRMNAKTRSIATHHSVKSFDVVIHMMSKVAMLLLEETATTWFRRKQYRQWCEYSRLSRKKQTRLDQWLWLVGRLAAVAWLTLLQPRSLFHWDHPFKER